MQDAAWSKCDKLNSCMQINVLFFFKLSEDSINIQFSGYHFIVQALQGEALFYFCYLYLNWP